MARMLTGIRLSTPQITVDDVSSLRRVLYELRAGREYFVSKERCVFCDILQQEERQSLRVIEVQRRLSGAVSVCSSGSL